MCFGADAARCAVVCVRAALCAFDLAFLSLHGTQQRATLIVDRLARRSRFVCLCMQAGGKHEAPADLNARRRMRRARGKHARAAARPPPAVAAAADQGRQRSARLAERKMLGLRHYTVLSTCCYNGAHHHDHWAGVKLVPRTDGQWRTVVARVG